MICSKRKKLYVNYILLKLRGKKKFKSKKLYLIFAKKNPLEQIYLTFPNLTICRKTQIKWEFDKASYVLGELTPKYIINILI